MSTSTPPLIVHIIHRLDVGGLENGLVNLINNLPLNKYNHAIICLTKSSDFRKRIYRSDVTIFELHKQDGKDFGYYFRLWKLLRKLRPMLVHTRNLSSLESSVVATFARVPIRIHGEHGRDIYDLHGANRKYQYLRRLCSPFVHKFIVMSRDLEQWMEKVVGIDSGKIVQIYNGVDSIRFRPRKDLAHDPENFPSAFVKPNSFIIGTVGRLDLVKDQLTLVKAFAQLLHNFPEQTDNCRLVILGDGPMRNEIEEYLLNIDFRIREKVWLAGSRDDVPEILSQFDLFVLPSLGEGISNTILEAMACGLPVLATRVGGNEELVQDNFTGKLVEAADPSVLEREIKNYLEHRDRGRTQGKQGRKRVEEHFAITTMAQHYQEVYDEYIPA